MQQASPTVIDENGSREELLPSQEPRIPYTDDLGHDILDRYISGSSIAAIARLSGMPSYGTILRWCTTHPEFSLKFEEARKMRALYFEDRVLQMAEEADGIGKDDVPAARLKYDVLRWGTESHDKDRYSKQTAIVGDTSRPVQIIVNTGIPQPETLAEIQPEEVLDKEVKPIIEAEFREVGVGKEESSPNN